MPVEQAQYLDTLTPEWPLGTDPQKDGDDHIRMIKQVLQNTFPNLNGAVNANPLSLNNLNAGITWNTPASEETPVHWKSRNPEINDGSFACFAALPPTKDYLNSYSYLVPTWKTIQDLIYPIGSVVIYADNVNPATRLGFGTWVAVVGDVYGVGAKADLGGLSVTFNAGDIGGHYRVQSTHIVAHDEQLAMDAVANHTHGGDANAMHGHVDGYPSQFEWVGDGRYRRGGGTTQAGGGHTPTGKVTIGDGTPTSGGKFMTPGYGLYVWRRTA